jgi:cytosine/adenosine deaminase-related metal-dependent hydrolase
MADESWSLTARWIFPVDGPPLERGVVRIQGDRIVGVELRGSLRADYDLGNAAILPGLVNAHTHLDLSNLRGQARPSADFVDWVRAVVRHRRQTNPEKVDTAIRTGLEECLASGTTLLGDISAGGLSWPILSTAPVRSIVFYEVLGLTEKRAGQALLDLRRWLDGIRPTKNTRAGISPHAPYSVRKSLFEASAELANQSGLPLAVHLAETQGELELLRWHKGPFVPFLEELAVWDPQGLVADPEAVLRVCSSPMRGLFIHGNYLPLSTQVPPTGTIVYCPRTHAAFGHGQHPFRGFLERGIRVALGTDSLASNPDLDVLAEARFIHERNPEVRGEFLLRMATLNGAEALGWAAETGSLSPGKSADLIVAPLPDREESDPHQLILDSTHNVASVLFRGKWTRGRP